MLLAGSFRFSFFLSSFFFFFSSFPPPVAATPGPRGAAPAELRAADGAAPSGPRRHRPELPRAAAGTPRASCCSGGARSGPTPRGRPVRWVMGKSCAARLRAGREKSLEKSGGAQESRRSFNPQNPAALGGARTGSGPEPQRAPRCPPPLTPTSLPGSERTERARGDEAGGTGPAGPLVAKIFGEMIAARSREGSGCRTRCRALISVLK